MRTNMNGPKLQQGFAPSGFFVLRTPLLPLDELLVWGAGLETASAAHDAAQLEAACAADQARLRQRLRAVFARPEVREALFIASPDLEERLDLWMAQPEHPSGLKMERALVRYFARMAGRATPFGLFAGCSVGTLGADSRLELAERGQYRRHTRLDMDYLVQLTDALARSPELRPSLRFGVNSSLHAAHGRFRYFEVRRNGKGWTHRQVALEAADYLQATLNHARAGALPGMLAAAILDDDPEAAREEAEEYITALIESQVLVSELRPTVTGPEPVAGLAARLRQHTRRKALLSRPDGSGEPSYRTPAAATQHPSIADQLQGVHEELAELDASGLGTEPGRYRRLAAQLQSLPGEVQLNRLFQVDLVKPAALLQLGSAVVAEIQRGIELLHRLARRPREDPLTRFREAFVNRYEGRAVPLIDALDPDTGIGFDTSAAGATDASSLLDGLTFPKPDDETVSWGKRDKTLLRLLCEALAAGAEEIRLMPRDWDELSTSNPPPLPDAFAAMASVAAVSEAAVAAGDFQVHLHGVTGPSGARLLGRFCHADPVLHQFVADHIRTEEALRPDAIFAEIVHLPEGRLGNILARPILRSHEIPYLGTASVPTGRQIPVSDLFVSVVGERIILRSARLGKEIVPRLTSAHNYHLSQGIYRFLCALQSQGTAGDLGWDWGPLRDAPCLPRVSSGRLVLARATWRVSQEELKPLVRENGAARFRTVQRWRTQRRLPRWIALADADNQLPIDLDNVLAVDTLIELAKEREQSTLVELFPPSNRLWARGPEGRFVQELIVPFVRNRERGMMNDERRTVHHSGFRVHRSFPPGSDWLYAKLYAGPAALDGLLCDVVKPVVERARQSGAADRWFFIRYGDPDWHLRLRLHGEPARLHVEVMPALQVAAAPLLGDGRVWRLQFDTYEREVERYGGYEGIALAERLFEADSEAVLELADGIGMDTRGDLRWRFALVGMHLLLTDLDFDLATRRLVVRKARDAFAAEFHTDAKFKHEISAKFRPERGKLQALLESNSADPQFATGVEILRRRSQRLAPVMAELRACSQAGRLLTPLAEIASSYLHMHANRLLRSAHRAQELMLHDYLCRLYEAQGARESNGSRLGGTH
jgi:thiopeptide-type bacteriocin biosynthesis protein